ncbi:hypothetical protein C2S53_008359 [Perilla frutescens var. hirtella]|uniref:Uncharacterized protein n=1 Tax=Perilla frutescens var. hirtella TaxID=608512 RepID=A0AAD4PA42_PERFH|nr:hypothetical protein C2S53_008359 [Perilla frutescens var. hirtella]
MSSSCKACEEGKIEMQVDLNGVEDSVEAISYSSELDFFQGYDDITEPGLLLPSKYEELQLLADFGALDDLYFDIVSPPFQACGDDELGLLSSNEPQESRLAESNEEKRSYAFVSASMEILRKYTRRVGGLGGEERGVVSNETKRQRASPSTLSVDHVIELAVRRFNTHSNSEVGKNLSAISHPHETAILGLSTSNAKEIQLVQDLLSCAEDVCNQHYDCASKFLEECSNMSSSPTNVIQRLVYYFSEALRDKIELETQRFTEKGMVNSRPLEFIPPMSATAAFLQKLPCSQVMLFAGIQLVVDHVSSRRKLHVIDLELHGGLRHAILMQTLAAGSECPLEHLKITAVATQSNLHIEEAGTRLETLAKSLNLSFSFHVISLDDILDLQQNLDPEETVVVQAAHTLRFMIPKVNQLENLMRAIRSLNPHVMIILEIEANIRSSVFVNRFVEALFFFGACFDYVEYYLKNDLTERAFVESKLLSPSMRHIVVAEEEEREFQMVGINVWREFLARFGMVETELSELALNHANLVLNMFECRDSCTLGLNGKSLTVGWKDTPIFSLSAWRFQGIGSS